MGLYNGKVQIANDFIKGTRISIQEFTNEILRVRRDIKSSFSPEINMQRGSEIIKNLSKRENIDKITVAGSHLNGEFITWNFTWNTNYLPITMHYNSSNAPNYAPNATTMSSLCTTAYSLWSDTYSFLTIQNSSPFTTSQGLNRDNFSVILWQNLFDTNILGRADLYPNDPVTQTFYGVDSNTGVDIVFNPEIGLKTWYFNQSAPTNRNDTEYDFIEVLAHELGHAVGLAHVVSNTNSIMYPYLGYRTGPIRGQSDGDLAGRVYQHPNSNISLSGTLSHSLVLGALANRNIQVTSDFTVGSGKTFGIEPGSVSNILFNSGKKLIVNGLLQVDGATFSGAQGVYWKGIKLINAENNSIIRNCSISNFGTGLGSDAIYIEECSPTIEYNYIGDGQYNGIKIYNGSPIIRYNVITNCSAGNGITVENQSSTSIYNNSISNNYFHGISIYNNNSAYSYIYDNNISQSSTYHGIRAYSSIASVYKNQISDCNYGFYTESYSTFFCNLDGSQITRNNLVENCNYGWVANNVSTIHGGEVVTPPNFFIRDKNSIRNITYNILHSGDNSTIYAQHNWLGSADYNIISSKIYGSIQSPVYWNYYLSSDPWTYGANIAATNANLSKDNIVDDDFEINKAYYLIDKGQYIGAKEIIKDLLNKGVHRALNLLFLLYSRSEDDEIITYMESIVSSVKPESENIYLNALAKLYITTNQYNKAEELLEGQIQKGYKNNKIEKFLLFALGIRDNKKALNILEEIKNELGDERADELYTILLPDPEGNVKYDNDSKSIISVSSNSSVPLLLPNFPNPFNPITAISFSLPYEGKVVMKVYDIMGREVITLLNETRSKGEYNLTWEGKDRVGKEVASGVYFYSLYFGNTLITKKMTLIK